MLAPTGDCRRDRTQPDVTTSSVKDPDRYGLGLRAEFKARPPELFADTRDARPRQRAAEIADFPCVHPGMANPDLRSDAQSPVDILSPEHGANPVFAVIGQGDGLFFSIKGGDMHHGTKQFFSVEARIRR